MRKAILVAITAGLAGVLLIHWIVRMSGSKKEIRSEDAPTLRVSVTVPVLFGRSKECEILVKRRAARASESRFLDAALLRALGDESSETSFYELIVVNSSGSALAVSPKDLTIDYPLGLTEPVLRLSEFARAGRGSAILLSRWDHDPSDPLPPGHLRHVIVGVNYRVDPESFESGTFKGIRLVRRMIDPRRIESWIEEPRPRARMTGNLFEEEAEERAARPDNAGGTEGR